MERSAWTLGRRRWARWLVLAICTLGLLPARAVRADKARCFDFSTKVVTPLKPALPAPAKGDAVDTGHRADGVIWARVRGTVAKAPARVLALLLNHETMRDPEIDEMQVKNRSSPDYLARHTVSYEVRPFPFVHVRWTEEWGYALAEAPDGTPATYVISYEKVEGTSYIAHFCGSIVLTRLGAAATDVYQYEEAKITRRNQEDQVNALANHLKKLRKAP